MLATLAALVIAGMVAAGLWNGVQGRVASSDAASASLTEEPYGSTVVATEEQIEYIRRVYQRIENGGASFGEWRVGLGSMVRQEWPSADSAYATVYDAGGIQKIRLRVYEGQMRTSLLFYYDAGSLVFVHEVKKRIGATTDAQQRYYFAGRTLIRWRDANNAIVLPDGGVYGRRAQALLRISDGMLERATGRV